MKLSFHSAVMFQVYSIKKDYSLFKITKIDREGEASAEVGMLIADFYKSANIQPLV